MSPNVDAVLFVQDIYTKYTVEVVPLCTYIVWFVIAAPDVRSVVSLRTVTLMMTIQNAIWTMSFLYLFSSSYIESHVIYHHLWLF